MTEVKFVGGEVKEVKAAGDGADDAGLDTKDLKASPEAQAVIEMATKLGIDASSEFYLLPIAKHALDAPTDLGAEKKNLEWFAQLVESERLRFARIPNEPSPWLRLTSADGRSYFFNFSTLRRAETLPRPKKSASDAVSKVDDSDLEIMRFTSWWTEGGGVKKYIYIRYHVSSEEFEVQLDKDERIYRLKSIQGRHGPVTCWDLHVGATINLFGRQTTLMQCDNSTRLWIEAHTRRLTKLKAQLEQKLAKFEKPPVTKTPKRAESQMHLRTLLKQTEKLKSQLAKHRPSLVADA